MRASFPQEQVQSILSLDGKQNDINRKSFLSFANKLGLQPVFIEKTLNECEGWLQLIEKYCERSVLTESRKKSYLSIVNERYSQIKN